MTKQRQPLTFADAVTRIASLLSVAGAARVVRRSERCLRDWSDPGTLTCPSLEQGLALDRAWRAAGGEGAPVLEAYAFMLGVQVREEPASCAALGADIAHAARECGEAIATGIAIAQPGARPAAVHQALVEAEEARGAIGLMIARLKLFLPRGAGLPGEFGGGAAT